ncbi:hypothetical protein [Teredinibacter haidensis]|uniref:hypothetical protein n=1 Tax=Teredinibacter haidensis TaxID=2731755 RepID=UPI000948B398|nr:hypothetical protein [Teredinibacter haidensis]
MSRLKQKGKTSVVKGKKTQKQQVNIFRMSTLAVAIHLLSVPTFAGPLRVARVKLIWNDAQQ